MKIQREKEFRKLNKITCRVKMAGRLEGEECILEVQNGMEQVEKKRKVFVSKSSIIRAIDKYKKDAALESSYRVGVLTSLLLDYYKVHLDEFREDLRKIPELRNIADAKAKELYMVNDQSDLKSYERYWDSSKKFFENFACKNVNII